MHTCKILLYARYYPKHDIFRVLHPTPLTKISSSKFAILLIMMLTNNNQEIIIISFLLPNYLHHH
jgi:hypothetical protein